MNKSIYKGKLIENPEYPACEVCGQFNYRFNHYLEGYFSDGTPYFVNEEYVEKNYTHTCDNCGGKYYFKKIENE